MHIDGQPDEGEAEIALNCEVPICEMLAISAGAKEGSHGVCSCLHRHREISQSS